MARSRRDPGDACWQMLFRAFQPQTTGQIKKVTSSERTRISYLTALTGATYVVLPKENHMQFTEAATLDRKSGEAEGSRPCRVSAIGAAPGVQQASGSCCDIPISSHVSFIAQ